MNGLTIKINFTKLQPFINQSVKPATLMRLFYFRATKLINGKDSAYRKVAGVSLRREQIFATFFMFKFREVIMSIKQTLSTIVKENQALKQEIETIRKDNYDLYDYMRRLHKRNKSRGKLIELALAKLVQ